MPKEAGTLSTQAAHPQPLPKGGEAGQTKGSKASKGAKASKTSNVSKGKSVTKSPLPSGGEGGGLLGGGPVGQPCPLCGQGVIIKGKAAYGCSRWKEGCTWRQPFSKE